jgi:CBS domain-containing protein
MTIEPDATIRAFADKLKVAGVGAMLVTDQKGALCGIISERDLARGVADFGPNLSSMHVSDMMTQSVVSCRPEDSVASAAKIMTQRRIRHLPVVVDGLLVGLVSIGDVLKYRLDEVQLEANVLRDVALARK